MCFCVRCTWRLFWSQREREGGGGGRAELCSRVESHSERLSYRLTVRLDPPHIERERERGRDPRRDWEGERERERERGERE